MKIGIIQGSSQKNKNLLLDISVRKALEGREFEIVNLGIFEDNSDEYSYVQVAIWISLLIESKALDFIITGCASGQGMMIACNNMPGIICGYIQNPTDAYLFGRINNGNVISYPLGLNFGWGAEINLINSIKALFEGELGVGYPKEDSKRKIYDAERLKEISQISKKSLTEILLCLDKEFIRKTLNYKIVYDYIIKSGKDENIKNLISKLKI